LCGVKAKILIFPFDEQEHEAGHPPSEITQQRFQLLIEAAAR
jgi:hypothetical protein